MAKFAVDSNNVVLFRGDTGVLNSGDRIIDTGTVALPDKCNAGSTWDGSGYTDGDFTARSVLNALKDEFQVRAKEAYFKAVSIDMHDEQWAIYSSTTTALSTQAANGTRKWHYNTKAIIDGILGGTIGSGWTTEIKRTALEGLISYLTLSNVWYKALLARKVTTATDTAAASWAAMSLASGAIMYHDGIVSTGALTTLDAAFDAVGWTFRANYDPEAQ